MRGFDRFDGTFVLVLLVGVVLVVPVVTLALAIVDVLGIANPFAVSLPVELSTYAEIAGVFGSTVLTLALVLLYRQQTRIQERQEEWMEAEHVPDVFVHRWEVTRNRFEFELSNLGTGVARNLKALVVVASPDTDSTTPVRFEADLTRSDSTAGILQGDSDADSTAFEGFAELDTENSSDKSGTAGIDDIVEELNHVDQPFVLTVSIEYEYIRREDESKEVFRCQAESEDADAIEDLILSNTVIYDTGMNVSPATL
jgi:hypothetical protein